MSALEFVMQGGVFLIPITLLLFYTIYVAIERYRYIKRMSTFNTSLLTEIKSHVDKGNVTDALNAAQRDNSAYGLVLSEGIKVAERQIGEIENNMEKVVNIEIGKMEKSLGHLGLIAGIAPTFGFISIVNDPPGETVGEIARLTSTFSPAPSTCVLATVPPILFANVACG